MMRARLKQSRFIILWWTEERLDSLQSLIIVFHQEVFLDLQVYDNPRAKGVWTRPFPIYFASDANFEVLASFSAQLGLLLLYSLCIIGTRKWRSPESSKKVAFKIGIGIYAIPLKPCNIVKPKSSNIILTWWTIIQKLGPKSVT